MTLRSHSPFVKLFAAAAFATILQGCTCEGPKSESKKDEAQTAVSPSPTNVTNTTDSSKLAEERVLNLFIWSEYTSPELLEQFRQKTGIRVVESNYTSNEELLAKLQAGATGFDVAVPSDYMVAVMAKLGLLSELNKANIPNAANVEPSLMGRSYDPQNTYSLPYAWTITGIAVNRTLHADPVTGWGDLLNNEKVKGKVSLLDDVREAMGAALKLNGASVNTLVPAELQKAKATLAEAKARVKAFNSTPADLLTSGEVVLAQMYSQEAMLAKRDSGKDIEFVVPKEGSAMAIDNMVVLKSAPHSAEAAAFINFMLDQDVNAAYVARTLAGPVVKDVRAKLPADLQKNESLFPSAAVLSTCEMMQDLGEGTAEYDRIWSEVKAASH